MMLLHIDCVTLTNFSAIVRRELVHLSPTPLASLSSI